MWKKAENFTGEIGRKYVLTLCKAEWGHFREKHVVRNKTYMLTILIM